MFRREVWGGGRHLETLSTSVVCASVGRDEISERGRVDRRGWKVDEGEDPAQEEEQPAGKGSQEPVVFRKPSGESLLWLLQSKEAESIIAFHGGEVVGVLDEVSAERRG